MAQELGKLEKPEAESFQTTRKLFFVPLLFTPQETEPELNEKLLRYWIQVDEHLANLEAKLGNVKRIYHELVPVKGETGLKILEEMRQGTYSIVKARLESGAELEALEDNETLAEFLDWSRCLSIGLQSRKAFDTAYEAYTKSQDERNKFMTKQLDETLPKNESGILFLREQHQVKFPKDVEVFYVAPPALDDIKRWLREKQAEAEKTEPEGTETADTKDSDAV